MQNMFVLCVAIAISMIVVTNVETNFYLGRHFYTSKNLICEDILLMTKTSSQISIFYILQVSQ